MRRAEAALDEALREQYRERYKILADSLDDEDEWSDAMLSADVLDDLDTAFHSGLTPRQALSFILGQWW